MKHKKGNIPLKKKENELFNSIASRSYQMPSDEVSLKDDYNRLKEYIEVNRTYQTLKENYNLTILSYMKKIEDELRSREVRLTLFRIMEDFHSEIETQMDLRNELEDTKGTNNQRLLKKRIQDSARKCKYFDKLLLENELLRDSKFYRLFNQPN